MYLKVKRLFTCIGHNILLDDLAQKLGSLGYITTREYKLDYKYDFVHPQQAIHKEFHAIIDLIAIGNDESIAFEYDTCSTPKFRSIMKVAQGEFTLGVLIVKHGVNFESAIDKIIKTWECNNLQSSNIALVSLKPYRLGVLRLKRGFKPRVMILFR